jgi:hypothetical protein
MTAIIVTLTLVDPEAGAAGRAGGSRWRRPLRRGSARTPVAQLTIFPPVARKATTS